jgi:hypothetical protein
LKSPFQHPQEYFFLGRMLFNRYFLKGRANLASQPDSASSFIKQKAANQTVASSNILKQDSKPTRAL